MGSVLVSIAGIVLICHGITRRSGRGAGYVLAGLGLIGTAAVGLADPQTATMKWRRLHHPTDADTVTTESMDSFPASDAPSSNVGAAS